MACLLQHHTRTNINTIIQTRTRVHIPELHYSDNLAVHLIDRTIHHPYKLLVLNISPNDFHTPPRVGRCWDDPVYRVPCVCVCVCVCGERRTWEVWDD